MPVPKEVEQEFQDALDAYIKDWKADLLAHAKEYEAKKEKREKPKCPHCGSSDYGLLPADFETARCHNCGKTWDHGIVPGINDPYEKRQVEVSGTITKLDKSRHLVFGWFSIVKVDGRPVVDSQQDIITPETLEDSAYQFVLNARVAGEMHNKDGDNTVVGVGRLVESVVFTKEKQAAIVSSLTDQHISAVMDLGMEGWWGGFRIEDEATWAKVVTGELRAFSIGGKGKREKISE
jgi:hypothetical protein